MNMFGESLHKNIKKAVHMLKDSSDFGSPDVCIVLAEAYEDRNLGFEEDYKKSANITFALQD